MKSLPIKHRIANAFGDSYSMRYHDLFRAVYPEDQFPKAYNYQSNGGPPGGAMALGRAIRELGLHHSKFQSNIVSMTDEARKKIAGLRKP